MNYTSKRKAKCLLKDLKARSFNGIPKIEWVTFLMTWDINSCFGLWIKYTLGYYTLLKKYYFS